MESGMGMIEDCMGLSMGINIDTGPNEESLKR